MRSAQASAWEATRVQNRDSSRSILAHASLDGGPRAGRAAGITHPAGEYAPVRGSARRSTGGWRSPRPPGRGFVWRQRSRAGRPLLQVTVRKVDGRPAVDASLSRLVREQRRRPVADRFTLVGEARHARAGMRFVRRFDPARRLVRPERSAARDVTMLPRDRSHIVTRDAARAGLAARRKPVA